VYYLVVDTRLLNYFNFPLTKNKIQYMHIPIDIKIKISL